MFGNYDSQNHLNLRTLWKGRARTEMSQGTRKKSYYAEDVGLSIQHIMRDLDWEDRQEKYEAITRTEECESEPIWVDQEDEDWLEKLYERPVWES